jgi:hypothetical protein
MLVFWGTKNAYLVNVLAPEQRSFVGRETLLNPLGLLVVQRRDSNQHHLL